MAKQKRCGSVRVSGKVSGCVANKKEECEGMRFQGDNPLCRLCKVAWPSSNTEKARSKRRGDESRVTA